MNKWIRNFFQIAFIFLTAAVLFRFFPIVVMFIETAALSIRYFWWVLLLIALSIWVIWVLNKRNPS